MVAYVDSIKADSVIKALPYVERGFLLCQRHSTKSVRLLGSYTQAWTTLTVDNFQTITLPKVMGSNMVPYTE